MPSRESAKADFGPWLPRIHPPVRNPATGPPAAQPFPSSRRAGRMRSRRRTGAGDAGYASGPLPARGPSAAHRRMKIVSAPALLLAAALLSACDSGEPAPPQPGELTVTLATPNPA